MTRSEINTLLRSGELEKLLNLIGEFHGHICPGIALGLVASVEAVRKVEMHFDGLEDTIVMCETNNCFCDAIQFITGCTLGNNALVFEDLGKMAFSVLNRDGEGYRILLKNDSKEFLNRQYPQYSEYYDKVVKQNIRNSSVVREYKLTGKEKATIIIQQNFSNLFTISQVKREIPVYAPSHESITCESCNELTMATRLIQNKGKTYCLKCANADFFRLSGNGISKEL